MLIAEAKHGTSNGLYQLIVKLYRCSKQQNDFIPLGKFICINFINTGMYFHDINVVNLVRVESNNAVKQWEYDIHDFKNFFYIC